MLGIPPKQSAVVDGRSFDYVLAGKGTPATVLVNGAGGPIDAWFRVFGPLSRMSSVFAYDRAGIGRSSKASEPQTGEVMVRDLRALLAAARVGPPHVLVGHSLGGLVANLFARSHPDEVAGVVLLEATAPDDIALMGSGKGAVQQLMERLVASAFRRDPLGEIAQAPRTAELIAAAGAFPDIPLIAVTGGKPAFRWATPAHQRTGRAANQRGLAALSPQGRQVMAVRSGHFPHFTEPAIVIEAVRDVRAAVRF